jgi:hypothetical protein
MEFGHCPVSWMKGSFRPWLSFIDDTELSHPNTLGVSPPEFVPLYMPLKIHREHYNHTSVQAPKQMVEKWDGKADCSS